jgi:divalent metal cation (Fe/Co/Zn/Cd) transporter
MRGADEERTEAAERRARRFIGITFFALSFYVAVEAALTLWNREAPEASLVGMVLTILSLVVMPLLSWAKLRTVRRLGSCALEAEAKETVACAWLSAITLVGLGLNAALGGGGPTRSPGSP